MSSTTVLKTSRPNFLILAPLCAWLGVILALEQGHEIHYEHIGLIVLGALLAHVAVNMLNEYQDFRSGLDFKTVKTPFSGGTGALPEDPGAASTVLVGAIASVVAVGAIGLYFTWLRGIPMLVTGLIGLVLVVAYTPWITRSAFLCLIAPGLGFGPAMILGTLIALGGELTAGAVVVAMMVFLLVSELLLINQFPDVEADREVGRRHLPIILGLPRTSLVVIGMLLGAFAILALAIASGRLPLSSALALLAFPAALYITWRLPRAASGLAALPPVLGINVGTVLASIALLALGLTFA